MRTANPTVLQRGHLKCLKVYKYSKEPRSPVDIRVLWSDNSPFEAKYIFLEI